MRARDLEGEIVSTDAGERTVGSKLGEGAEGVVYRLQGTEMVAKVFFQSNRDDLIQRKLREMIDDPPVDPTMATRDIVSLVWPTDVVKTRSGDEFLGYAMPCVDLSRWENALTYAKDELAWSNSDWDERCRTAVNLASTVAVVHHQGHALGDMNHQNVYVRDGFVALIDCDSFHIQGRDEVYPGETVFGRYAPPEGRGNTLEQVRSADRFGLAIHVFQFLMGGFHPYQAKGSEAVSGTYIDAIDKNAFPYPNPDPDLLEPHDAAPSYADLPEQLRDLFEACFVEGKTRPAKRPEARDWIEVLLDESDLSNTFEGAAFDQSAGKRQTANRSAETTSPSTATDTTPRRAVDDSDEAWYEALRAGATEDVEADDTTTPESEAGYSSSSGDTEDRWFEDIRSEGSGDDTGSQPPPISISDSAAATQTSNVAGTVPLVSRIAIYLALVVAALTIATMAL